MVGIVLISHSRNLAEALAALAHQVSDAEIQIAIAGGVGDDRQEFGTDAIELMAAIESVHSLDGVVVLMDLGSAVLSAKLALELLPPEVSAGVKLCPAPFVEGAIAAAVQASLGSDAETIYQEAMSALAAKLDQLVGEQIVLASERVLESGSLVDSSETMSTGWSNQIVLTVRNLHGLHARPAARLVKTAAAYDAEVELWNISNSKGPVSAKSLNSVATLGAVGGHQIGIRATGPDAEQVLIALTALVESGFGELTEGRAEIISRSQQTALAKSGDDLVPISDGIAVGPIYHYRPLAPQVFETQLKSKEQPQGAWKDLETAIDATSKAIGERRVQISTQIGEQEAAIFDAHELILKDPDLLNGARRAILEDNLNPAYAWQQAIQKVIDAYNALADPYLQMRSADVRDVGNQVLISLAGKASSSKIELPGPVILYAGEITPTETAQIDLTKVLGLITVSGGPTSHSAIIARALGIPAVSGAGPKFENLPDGVMVGLNGFEGKIEINLSPEEIHEYAARRAAWLSERESLRYLSQQPGMTRDGRRVEMAANVGSDVEARDGFDNGAEAIGLLRTEFLFLTRETAPTELEQHDMLLKIGMAFTNHGKVERPIIVRTLDVGGDKELPYIDLGKEANPFLGVRALRLSLRRPELFIPQLKAILRAGAIYRFKIMFPMVANLDEIKLAKKYLSEAHQALLDDGVPHAWPIECGIMIEIPAAALTSDILAAEVDFFSIGTNDLTQYTLAAERGNPELAGMADALHPAVLRLVSIVIENAHRHGKWVGVCGELAGDPVGAAVLVGLGVDELSMSPASLPRVKAIISSLDLSEMKDLSQKVLKAPDSQAARKIAEKLITRVVEKGI